MENIEDQKPKEDVKNTLDKFLGKPLCDGDECFIKDTDEIVKKEHKKIITNDGRQLLSEYIIY